MTARNPYVGPEALSADHRIYGRKAEIESLRDLLIAERVVLLYSPSGAGKTSLIQAGLLRELRDKEKFRVCLIRGFPSGLGEGNRYLGSVYDVLEGALPEDGRKGKDSAASLDEYLKNRPAVATEGPLDADELVLIFDQFEEIFTRDPFDREAKTEFFRALGQALKDKTRWALFSMREDYIAELDDYLHLLPTQLKTCYRLGLLERPQAQQAIEGPADEQGVKFAEGTANLIINDLCKVCWQTELGDAEERQGNVVEPVQLQVVCYHLWEQCFPQPFEPPATITETDVRHLSVDRALEDFYANQVRRVALGANVQERDVREWVENKLITAQGLRGQVMWGPQQSGGLANEAIKCLENAHIVRLEARGERKWFELTHDRLLKPVADSNRTWFDQHLELLQLRTKQWEARGRSHDFGLSPIEWFTARRWIRAHQSIVRPTEAEFLSYSGVRIRTKYVLPVLVISLLMAGALGFGFYQQAQKARSTVQSLAYEAQVNAMRRTMDDALIGAAQAAKGYQELAQDGMLEDLVARARAAFGISGSLWTGMREDLAVTVRETLFTTLRNAQDLRLVLVGDNTLYRAVAFQPTNPNQSSKRTLLAYAGAGGQIFLSSVDREYVRELPACPDNAVYSLAFSPSGSLLAAGCGDGRVAVWNTADWEERSRWQAHKGKAWVVAFNRDGTQVASGGYDSKITLMQLAADGSKPSPDSQAAVLPANPGGRIWSLAMSPTADLLVAGDGMNNLWLCITTAPQACQSVDTRVASVNDVDATLTAAFSTDGGHFVTGHWSGALVLWDVQKLQMALGAGANNAKVLPPHTRKELSVSSSPIYSLAFIERGGVPLVTFSSDRLRQVSLTGDVPGRRRAPIVDEDIYSLSFHAPTGLLATATLGGYVALVETQNRQERITRKLALESAPPQPCRVAADQPPLPQGPRRGAVVDDGEAGTRLVIAGCDQLFVIGVEKGSQGRIHELQTLSSIQVGQGPVERVTASSKKRRVATLGKNGTIKFWKLDGDTLAEDADLPPLNANFLKTHGFADAEPRRILLSPDGDWIFCSFEDEGRLLQVHLRENELKALTISTPFREVKELALSTDGKLLAAGGPFLAQGTKMTKREHGVAVWNFDLSNGKLEARDSGTMYLTPLADKVFELAVVRDRKGRPLVVAGGDQGQINVWDIGSNQVQPRVLRMDSRPITQFAFVPEQGLLAVANELGKITLWDTGSWQMMALTGREDVMQKVGLLGYGSGGGILISGAQDLTVWDLDIASLRSRVCDILGAGKAHGQPPPGKRLSEACN